MTGKHRVYFIGSGPGAPDLLTLRGAERLARSPAVFAPRPFEETFGDLLVGKEVLVPFDFSFNELLEKIEILASSGDVSFLIPGDLTFYSPFQAVIDRLGERAEVIPGVGTANAASARLKRTLTPPGGCTHAVIASPRVLAETGDALSLRELIVPGATLLLYMNHLPLPELVTELRLGFGKNVPIALFHRLGLPGEAVLAGTLDDIADRTAGRDLFHLEAKGKGPALTFILAGEALAAASSGTWWDCRREEVWKQREIP